MHLWVCPRAAAGADPSHPSNRKSGACWGPHPRVLFPRQEAKGGLLGGPVRKLKRTLAHDGPLGMTRIEHRETGVRARAHRITMESSCGFVSLVVKRFCYRPKPALSICSRAASAVEPMPCTLSLKSSGLVAFSMAVS